MLCEMWELGGLIARVEKCLNKSLVKLFLWIFYQHWPGQWHVTGKYYETWQWHTFCIWILPIEQRHGEKNWHLTRNTTETEKSLSGSVWPFRLDSKMPNAMQKQCEKRGETSIEMETWWWDVITHLGVWHRRNTATVEMRTRDMLTSLLCWRNTLGDVEAVKHL